MKHEMRIELSTADGAMLRTIGLVERRGFFLQSCTLHDAQGDCRVLDIAVESGRPVEVLKRQIERLHDVQSVQLKTAARQPVKNVGLRSSMGRQR
jgi:acetolactate synthase regulatory subunit